MPRFLPSAVLFLFFLTLCQSAFSQSMVMIDSRLLLLAHPVYRAFNPATKRFDGTSSEPTFEGREGIEKLKSSLHSLEEKKKKLAREAMEAMARAPKREKGALEKQLLQKRQQLDRDIQLIRKRIESVQGVPGNPGLTDGRSILPQIHQISNDIITAARKTREQYRAAGVIDIASLLPSENFPLDDRLLMRNLHFGFWRNPRSMPQEFTSWVENARSYWSNRKNAFLPVPYGAYDGRWDSIQWLKKLSEGN